LEYITEDCGEACRDFREEVDEENEEEAKGAAVASLAKHVPNTSS
jgi:hypothetical protein